MSDSPTVSVLTTVYNRAKFLGECIESVQQSRFSDYEHIIVDDGSTDDSVAIAKRYAAQDSRIKVFVNEKNLGDYPNRNQAAKHASGKYLKYLDADDLHGPWILNVMVDAMEQFPDCRCGIVRSWKRKHTRCTSISPVKLSTPIIKRHWTFSVDRLLVPSSEKCISTASRVSRAQHMGDHELWHRISFILTWWSCLQMAALSEFTTTNRVRTTRTDLSVPFKYTTLHSWHDATPCKFGPEFKTASSTIIGRRQARTAFGFRKADESMRCA